MAKITPKFDFTAAVAQVGIGQSHTSAQIAENNLAPIKFNEYERIMVLLCEALGNSDLSDVFPGASPTIESAFRTLSSIYDQRFLSIDTGLSTYQSALVAMESSISTNYTSMLGLFTNEQTDRQAADTALSNRIDSLNTVVLNSSSATSEAITAFQDSVSASINGLKEIVVYKNNATSQTITGPMNFEGTVSLSGSSVLDATDRPIKTSYVASSANDVTNISYCNNHYVKQEGDGKVTGNFEITGLLKGGFPVGTIMMYDNTDWVDNTTLPGWYSCIADNVVPHNCPNLVDRFVMGRAPGTPPVSDGHNTIKLTMNQLPSHTHTIEHEHSAHSHTIPVHTHTLSGTSEFNISTGETAQVSTSFSDLSLTAAPHIHSSDLVQPEFSITTPEIKLVTGTEGSYAGYDLSSLYKTDASTEVPSSGIISRTKDFALTLSSGEVTVSASPHYHSVSASTLVTAQSVIVDFSQGVVGESSITLDSTAISLDASIVSGTRGEGADIDIKPSYYSVIFIRRCE